METVKKPSSTPNINRLLLRTFSKLFRIKRKPPNDKIPRLKFDEGESEKIRHKLALEALFAKLFACVSSVKATYAQLQISQSPYDPDGIQTADKLVVSELKHLSEVKQSYLKKQQLDESPQVTFQLAQLEEEKSLLKMYEITAHKLESQIKLKDSEIQFLKEKLEEFLYHNGLLENRIADSDYMFIIPDDVSLHELSITHFVTFLQQTIQSVRSFSRLFVGNITDLGWDIVSVAASIEPNVGYEKMYVFESFMFRNMFDSFRYPKFGLAKDGKLSGNLNQDRSHFLDRFMEMRKTNVEEYLTWKPKSTFGKFLRNKYLGLVHPKMELAFFGDLKQRNMLDSGGGYPETGFFRSFAEMAKRVWLLHCLGFSFEPEASIFQVKRGCRFSEVFMENVVEDEEREIMDPRVGFVVVPGFKIGKTVVQCQVYLKSGE